ncbi:MAG: 4Fe-4S binding protein [Coriobacteriia bacterium]|nr:4Fe-4S binding protein [Coriobacteriia bacterium]
MALDKKKVKRLIGMMNQMTAVEIPPMGPIIRCFELGMDEDILNYLLRVGTTGHTKQNLEELYQTMRATGEISTKRTWDELWDEIMIMSFMVPCERSNDTYELASIFPGWIELCTSGPRTEKRVAIMESFMDFWKLLKTLNVGPIRKKFDKEGLEIKAAGASRMGSLTSITPARRSKKAIAVDEPLTSEQTVLPKGTAFEILDRNKDKIAVMNCICRNHKEVNGDGNCDVDIPLQSCMPVGNIATQLINSGVADAISYEDAVELMKEFERKGCIHTTFHYAGNADHDELCICNCCKDCCLLYGGYQEGYLSKVQVKAYNVPEIVDMDACTGCGKCSEFCPADAISYNKATKKLDFTFDQCVGCGQCVVQCAFGVQRMVPNERHVYAMTKKKR